MEIADLTQEPNPDHHQDEGDSDPEMRKLEGEIFLINKCLFKKFHSS